MVTMDDLSRAIILLVCMGAAARFIYRMVWLAAAEEQAAQYKRRTCNTVILYVIAEPIWQVEDLILHYYSQEVRMDKDLKLYIPLGTRSKAGLFIGFGKKQLFQALIGSLVIGDAATLIQLFTANATTTVVLALTDILGSVMMTTKDQSNLSVVDQVQSLARFLSEQKIYPYRYGDRWGLE